ncbi:hypothetical protein ACE6H2_020263 [Prunus campanulata]
MHQRGILISSEHINHFIRSGIRLLIITIILQKVVQINSIMDPFCEIPIMQKQMQASKVSTNQIMLRLVTTYVQKEIMGSLPIEEEPLLPPLPFSSFP